MQISFTDVAAAAKLCRFTALNMQADLTKLQQDAKLSPVEPEKQGDRQNIAKYGSVAGQSAC